MKNILKIALAVLMTALLGLSASAQNASQQQQQKKSREQLAEAQAHYIARQLALDDQTAAQFVATYCNAQKELWAIKPHMRGKGKYTTDADAQQAINSRFERSQKILALREKYYKQYSRFLTQKQIARVYELERGMMKRLGQKKGRQCGRRQGSLGANHTCTGQGNTK